MNNTIPSDGVKAQKVINALKEKVTELESILPKEVFDFKNFYFAGGCIYSLWNDKEPKDYDIFCTSRSVVNDLLQYFKSNRDKVNMITENAITMGKYQFVIRHVGNPDVEVLKFDFKHNMFYFSEDGLFAMTDWGYLDSNKLEFNSGRARDILNIIARIPKFVGRGMEISQSEIFDILEKGTRPTKYFAERANVKKSRRGKTRY